MAFTRGCTVWGYMRNNRNRVRKVMEFFLITLLVYALFVAFLYLRQRSFIYYPDQLPPSRIAAGVPDMHDITVTTKDGLQLNAWYKEPADSGKPVIVLFHGNGGNIGWRGIKARLFINNGYGFLLAEYRGYAANPGKPSEQGLYKDARAYMAFLLEEGLQPKDIVLYGESLGTAIAVKMAAEYPDLYAVVLETPYTSMSELAQKHLFYAPAHLLIRDRYDSMSRIANLTAPLLVIHGTADGIVPYNLGRKLFDAATQPKVMETVDRGGHNNLYSFGIADKIISFLNDLAPTARHHNPE